jgi:hypothetical protein
MNLQIALLHHLMYQRQEWVFGSSPHVSGFLFRLGLFVRHWLWLPTFSSDLPELKDPFDSGIFLLVIPKLEPVVSFRLRQLGWFFEGKTFRKVLPIHILRLRAEERIPTDCAIWLSCGLS